MGRIELLLGALPDEATPLDGPAIREILESTLEIRHR
jgi:hypothetical protein